MQTKASLGEELLQGIVNEPVLVRPVTQPIDTETIPLPRVGSPETDTLNEQITYFRMLLDKEAYLAALKAPGSAIAADAYAAEATKIHNVKGMPVGIFAPFVLARSALRTIYKRQIAVMLLIGLGILAALFVNLALTLTILMGAVTAFYFANLLLTLYLSLDVLDHSDEVQIADEVVHGLADVKWPRYTILCPLYKEAAVVSQFAAAMRKLDYPTDKLQILFLTEADDEGTRDAIRAANLPSYFEIVVVPDGQPRTKPRACNYGLLQATGEFVVIYDAEDVPDPLQLKKAVLAFAEHGTDIGCIQAKLNFYNSTQNVLTRWFTIEYSTWFDATLPGLQWGELALPLGGTSNHFRLSTLRGIGAWDAYNVTEDCDLGLRLASEGYRTLVLDSITYEEANPHVKNWIRQRSRWIKGYMQTYLIYMRQPFLYLNPFRWRDFVSMQLIVGGRTGVLLINPLMWAMVALYLVFRGIPTVVDVYHTLFPGLVLYFAILCLIFGNLTYIYTHFIGCIKRGEYGLVKWTLLMPIYWILASYAAFKALYQLITKPHYWEKTTHGLHLPQQPAEAVNGQTDKPNSTITDSAVPTATWVINAEKAASTHAAAVVEQSAQNWLLEASAAIKTTTEPPTVQWRPEFEQLTRFQTTVREPLRSRLMRVLVRERWLALTIMIATIAGILSTIHYFTNHDLLIYKDASSHLGIARLIFDNSRPGLAHLGGIWLPLPHLLMLPFSAVDYLWRTGLAGACVSMPSYVITAIYIFLAARRLTKSDIASFVGTLVFVLNPNVLYLQATPLTEPLAAATITAACYYFLAWLQDEKPKQIILMALATFLASLSRYDGWSLFIGFTVLVPFVTLLKRRGRYQIEANTIVFVLVGCLGVAMWIAWCWLILGDPLYWQRSEYSSQAQQAELITKNLLYTYHDVYQSVRFFTVLTAVTMGPLVFGISVLGMAIFIVQRRISLETVAGLIFLIPFAFYVFSLYSGQIILYLPELVPADAPDKFFNNRFGMVGVPPAAIFCAVFVAFVTPRVRMLLAKLRGSHSMGYQYAVPVLCSFIIAGQSVVTTANGIVSLQDGQLGRSCQPNQTIVDYMALHYDGGKILLDTFVNSRLYLMGPIAGVDFKNIVYQGSGAEWENALKDPGSVVEWVVAVPNSKDDKVSRAIDVTSVLFRAQFTLIMEDQWGLALYRRSDLPTVVARPLRPESVFDNPTCSGF